MTEKFLSYLAAMSLVGIVYLPIFRAWIGISESFYLILFFVFFLCFLLNAVITPIKKSRFFLLCFLIVVYLYIILVSAVFGSAAHWYLSLYILIAFSLFFMSSSDLPVTFYRSIFILFLISSLLLAIGLIVMSVYSGGDFRKVLDVNYLTSAKLVFVAYLILLPRVFCSGKKTTFIFMLLVLFVGISVSLARGALLFAILLTIVTAIFYWPSGSTDIRLGWLKRLVPMLFGIFVFLLIAPERTILRLERLFLGDEVSSGDRVVMWANAVNETTEHFFFGAGLGKYQYGEHFSYPHNLFLQVGLDFGLVGIFLFSCVVLLPVFFALLAFFVRGSKDYYLIGFFLAYLGLLLEYSKSGDFYLARDFFIFGGVLLGYSSRFFRFTYHSVGLRVL